MKRLLVLLMVIVVGCKPQVACIELHVVGMAVRDSSGVVLDSVGNPIIVKVMPTLISPSCPLGSI
jgi:hypothetical protein